MKRKLISVVSLLLSLIVALFSSACTKRVKAENLMEAITSQSVVGKEYDEAFVLTQTQFALDLFKASVEETGAQNTLISPTSVMIALAMLANGANGQTKEQIQRIIGGGQITIERLNEYLYYYVNALPSENKYKLDIANSIWLRDHKDFIVEKDFLQTNADYYKADVFKALFDNSTVNDINNWVFNKTDGLIKKAIDQIKEENIAYLINTVLFDAEWQKIYESDHVKQEAFVNADGTETDVKMMRDAHYQYLELANGGGFMKSYKNNAYSFVGLLPNEGVEINEFINSLNAQELVATLTKPSTKYDVYSKLPKFEYDYSVSLNKSLEKMGMKDAFSVEKADFSRLGTYRKDEGYNIFVGNVLHKTTIQVGEKGTKAGAVTVIEINGATSAEPREKKYVYLTRPFVYMIIDNQAKLPIFIGHVNYL